MFQSKNNFVDFVRIYCKSGKGGSGSKHLRRDRLTAKGGPDGEMAEEVVILLSNRIEISGPYYI